LGAGGTNRLPNVPRNAYNLPTTANFDLRIAYGFPLGGGGRKLEAIADVFNMFNHLNYTAANMLMYTVQGTATAPELAYNSAFGTLTNANSNYFVFTPRQLQLALRYSF
jgi:hypothetical protein